MVSKYGKKSWETIEADIIISGLKGEIPEDEYTIPLGKADIKREGSDVIVVATSLMVRRALAAAAKLQGKGISIEVIDPRTLSPLDKQAIMTQSKRRVGW